MLPYLRRLDPAKSDAATKEVKRTLPNPVPGGTLFGRFERATDPLWAARAFSGGTESWIPKRSLVGESACVVDSEPADGSCLFS